MVAQESYADGVRANRATVDFLRRNALKEGGPGWRRPKLTDKPTDLRGIDARAEEGASEIALFIRRTSDASVVKLYPRDLKSSKLDCDYVVAPVIDTSGDKWEVTALGIWWREPLWALVAAHRADPYKWVGGIDFEPAPKEKGNEYGESWALHTPPLYTWFEAWS